MNYFKIKSIVFILLLLSLQLSCVFAADNKSKFALMEIGNIYGNCEMLSLLLEYQIIKNGKLSADTDGFLKYLSNKWKHDSSTGVLEFCTRVKKEYDQVRELIEKGKPGHGKR